MWTQPPLWHAEGARNLDARHAATLDDFGFTSGSRSIAVFGVTRALPSTRQARLLLAGQG
jgi:hypothetical protein